MNIQYFAQYAQQADWAVKNQLYYEKNSTELIFTYQELHLFHLFQALDKQSTNGLVDYNLNIHCHPALSILHQYDLENHTELLPTLHAYITYLYNIKATATKLFIHRNSLIYRLERIKELTGLNLKNPDIRFDLEFSFYVYKFQQQSPFSLTYTE